MNPPPPAARPALLAWPWIINRREDLWWLSGGALAAWLLCALVVGWGANLIVVWFVWVTLIDTPHFFGTYSRTFLQREEWQRRRGLLLGSCGLLLAGPLAILVCAILHRAGVVWYAWPWKLFVAWFLFEAYWHVLRQHYGILALYSRKNGETAPADRAIDRWAMHLALLAPAAGFLAKNPEARTAFGLTALPAAPVVAATAAVAAGAAVALFGRQIWRWRAGAPLNGPKLIFLLAVLPVQAFVSFHPAVAVAPLLAYSIFVTVHHDFQYQAIVWFWHRNRRLASGATGRVTRNLATFLASGLAMAVVFRLLGCSLEITEGCVPVIHTSTRQLFGEISLRELLTGVFLGFPLQHYLLDRHIWRPSRDAALERDLRVA